MAKRRLSRSTHGGSVTTRKAPFTRKPAWKRTAGETRRSDAPSRHVDRALDGEGPAHLEPVAAHLERAIGSFSRNNSAEESGGAWLNEGVPSISRSTLLRRLPCATAALRLRKGLERTCTGAGAPAPVCGRRIAARATTRDTGQGLIWISE